MLLGFAFGASLITSVEFGSRIDLASGGAQEHVTDERQHDADRNADIGYVKDGKVDERGGYKIGHKAKDKAIDRVADGAARNHSHAHNLKTSELRRMEQVQGNSDNYRQRQYGKRNTMPLAHAKGSSDIADKQKVNHTGDNGHMQSIAHGTNRKLGQLVNEQHNERYPTSNT